MSQNKSVNKVTSYKLPSEQFPKQEILNLDIFYAWGEAVRYFKDSTRLKDSKGILVALEHSSPSIAKKYSLINDNHNIADNNQLDIENYFVEKRTDLDDYIKRIQEEFKNLIDFSQHFGFEVNFIELALFDPKDREARSFFVTLFGSNRKVLENYLREIEANVKEARGPIISNPSFYLSPLFYWSLDTQQVPVKCDSLEIEEAAFALVSYEKLEVNKQKKNIEESLKDFIESVVFKCLKSDQKESSQEAEFSIILPIYRPAGVLSKNDNSEVMDRYRGGSLFLYGKRKERFNIDEFSLRLRAEINKAVMHKSFTMIDWQIQEARYKAKLAVAHSLPHAFATSIQYLKDYRKNNPDFKIPPSLYSAALETALLSNQGREEDIFKYLIRLENVEKIVREKGLCDELFQELTGDGQIARVLAESRLANDRNPIYSVFLKKPEIRVEGSLKGEDLGQKSSLEIPVLIEVLIILLKEAIEHTERFLRDVQPSDDNKKNIWIYLKENKVIIKNPKQGFIALSDDSMQAASIGLLEPYLKKWRVLSPEIKDGWWIRELVKQS